MRPGTRHGIIAAAAALTALAVLLQRAEVPWIADWPWAVIAGLIAAFGLGQAAADFADRRSWLRRKYDSFGRIFEIEHVARIHQIENQKEWIEPTAVLRFGEGIRNADITATVSLPGAESFILDNRVLDTVSGEHRETIALAVIPLARSDGKPQGHTSWGPRYREAEDLTGLQKLLPEQDYVVTIEVAARGKKPQKENIVLHLSDTARTDSHLFLLKDGDRGLEIVAR